MAIFEISIPFYISIIFLVYNTKSIHGATLNSSLSQSIQYYDITTRFPTVLHVINNTSRSTTTPKREGWTLDFCLKEEDCISPRRCIKVSQGLNNAVPCDGTRCLCIGKRTQLCNICKECENYPKETCQTDSVKPAKSGVCISTYNVYEGFTVELGCDTYPEITPIPEDAFPSEQNDSPFYQNSSYYSGATFAPTPSPSPGSSRSTSTTSSPPTPTSTSTSTPTSTSTTEAAGCIDAKYVALEHRLYKQHKIAGVLCDGHGSCATPGHMVVFDKRPMSMQQYCVLNSTGCVKRVMHVNSPKFSKGLRIESATKSLHFTALAAQYESRLEEVVLTAAIHIGL